MESWSDALAAARLSPAEGPPASTIAVSSDGASTSALLTCPAPAVGSSAAVANLLLQEFVAAARPSRQGLSRAVQVEVVSSGAGRPGGQGEAAAAAAAGPSSGGGEQQQQQRGQMVVRFTTAGADAGAAEQVGAVAAAFEAHLQFHIKAAKSSVHTRMRQRLVGLRQQLGLARHPAPPEPLVV